MAIDRFECVTECEHREIVSFGSNGVERRVCQECGHVTVRFEGWITGDIDWLISRRVGRTRIK